MSVKYSGSLLKRFSDGFEQNANKISSLQKSSNPSQHTHTHTHTHTITFKILSYHTTVFYPSTDLISTRLFLYFPLILDIVIFYWYVLYVVDFTYFYLSCQFWGSFQSRDSYLYCLILGSTFELFFIPSTCSFLFSFY